LDGHAAWFIALAAGNLKSEISTYFKFVEKAAEVYAKA